MTRTVNCVLLGTPAEGLEKPPYPGELGQRIYDNVSAEAWRQWLERLVLIVNECQLNSADPANQELVEKHLVGFLFKEGDYGDLPAGFNPRT